MDIYGHQQSAQTREIRILCAQLDIDYELVEVNQGDLIYLPDALNPLCKVPMIDDQGFMLAEVHAIQRYLVATRGAADTVYPADYQQRAVADQWLDWQTTRLAPLSAEQIYCGCLNPRVEGATRRLEHAAETLEQLLPELERALTEQQFDAEMVSLVTIALGVSLEQLQLGGYSLQPWPHIADCQQRWSALPVFKNTRPPLE